MAGDSVKIPGWITWLSGAILTAMTSGLFIAAYAFTNFETTSQAERREKSVMERLERIENKLDSALSRRR